MLPLPTLGDEPVVLRAQRDDDLPALAGFLVDPSVARWFGRDDVERLRSEHGEDARSEVDGAAFTIVCGGSVAGWLLVTEEPDADYRCAGLDIMLGPTFQGRGIGPVALHLAARWLIDARGHHRLTIDPALANRAAITAYRRLGFRDVGVEREYARRADGIWEDGLMMDLLARELVDPGPVRGN